ncbi:MAG: hypothetical protein HUU20_23760 [Pirellulales bacterium]|nr:hypothetical protein [Pirellulales bacterium]
MTRKLTPFLLPVIAGVIGSAAALTSNGQAVAPAATEPPMLLQLDETAKAPQPMENLALPDPKGPVEPNVPAENTTKATDAPVPEPATEAASEDAGKTVTVADPKAAVEVVQERYPSGKMKVRREVTLDSNGSYILHGEWSMWNEMGNQIATGKYRNNQRQGRWTRSHSGSDCELFSEMPYKEFTAPFISQADFEDGRLHGKWTISDSQGRKISEAEYAKGVLHGLYTLYYPSGQVMREAVFRNGLIDGYLHHYEKDSTLVVDEIYQEGRKLAPKVEYDKAGKKKSEGIYLHARHVIESADDWWNARPVKYVKTGDDVQHGCWTGWYPSGQKRVEGIYEYGLQEGQFTWWFANGQQAVVGNFKKGKPHGVWAWWHENGQKATSGQYTDGEPSGAWAYWQENGQLAEKTDFSPTADTVLVEPKQQGEATATDAPNPQETAIPRTAAAPRNPAVPYRAEGPRKAVTSQRPVTGRTRR